MIAGDDLAAAVGALLLGLIGLALIATVRKFRDDWRIDLDELTSDWEWREAADPQRPFRGASRDRSLRGKQRRKARRSTS